MARISSFTKISGYKHVFKCKLCGKKSTSDKNDIYCKECQKKMQQEWENNKKLAESSAKK